MSFYWYLRNKETNEAVHIGQSPMTTDLKPKVVYQYSYISDFIASGSDFELINETQAFDLDCEDITTD